ncbi:hypothetical protein WMF31_04525 [Sorangium sp. So ce1036]|uniref:hypothetical protein n=1 Tax=Sorangium sp. So ce1036 TaxID=3133328 RepID=UPI003F02A863
MSGGPAGAARGRPPRRAPRAAGTAAAAWLAALAAAGPALGQAPSPGAGELVVDAAPVFGTSGALPWGWNQIVVRVQNNGGAAARGEVEIASKRFSNQPDFVASAPYSVAAGASIHVRVPVQVSPFGDVQVRALDERGAPVSSHALASTSQRAVVLLDVSEPSRLRATLHEAPVAPLYLPTGRGAGPSPGPVLWVGQPRFDGATGDPLLPDRAALYSAVDAVLMRTDTLSRLGGAELEALAGYVLSGGTLALAVARPEDLRHPALAALVGGEVAKAGVAPPTLEEILPPSVSSGFGTPENALAPAPGARPEVAEALSGWSGGNLRGSAYGSSASYGLGEVHLLAFDPTRPQAASDPWVKIRMADLARRAHDRRSTVAFRPGEESLGLDLDRVRRELDPNESARWAIGLSAFLLCLYAVLAGPINFARAARQGRPLRALRRLPVLAAVMFAVIVGVGVLAKGVGGRARHLTLIEAGAGMSKGSARRFRAFYVSSAEDLTVRTTDASGVISTAVLAELSARRDRLVVDRDGARLTEVAALPWQTVIVREDGVAPLGDGIAIVAEPGGDTVVSNRSGRDLRGGILWLPAGEARYFARIRDGERVSSRAGAGGGVDLRARVEGQAWLSHVGFGRRVGGIDVHDLGGSLLVPLLEPDAPGLGGAWWAIEEAAGDAIDWFPSGVPVLLGQLDGGEGRTSDSGLRLESDRVLVRIVGYGGRS